MKAQHQAVDAAVFVLGIMLDAAGPELFGWNEDFDFANLSEARLNFIRGKIPDHLEQLSARRKFENADWARIESDTSEIDDQMVRENLLTKYALVEFEGLLLGCDTFTPHDVIHFAHASAPIAAKERFQKSQRADPMFGRNVRAVREQISFEMQRDAAEVFFSSNHFHTNLSDADDSERRNIPEVAPVAILGSGPIDLRRAV